MKKLPQITEAEYEIMKVVWKKAPVSTNEITEFLVKTTTWSPKTIQTLIKRLVNKGALTYEKEGRVFVYTPLVREDEYLEYENNTFLNRYYDGNLTSMITNFLEKERLSGEEIQKLKDLLNRKTDSR
ncbi:BlaI/MecI/CopY family transcriptional regulator [Lactonifactor longoviformis]|uniref:BlaI family transcriptional regulator, penicillinase repressor n=1 Tax=Lactonifactor longoviformis DSM 17459 TaxID=1122155 RepID=A0A1M4YFN4_9CLOT|nr:BlaI/MecI/CopY family transcriptional regulator [Lactonifactor longoviformis]POP34006.1 BlaI/MecI/CopY family transcriptional regulator [Lactonifactor longoviformis]SHF04322.1 BlaI family transcriptional regulator, penicillinase repressor [Lactonifactor longoviformis DSM 17459]